MKNIRNKKSLTCWVGEDERGNILRDLSSKKENQKLNVEVKAASFEHNAHGTEAKKGLSTYLSMLMAKSAMYCCDPLVSELPQAFFTPA